MSVISSQSTLHADMIGWRRDIHAHPETAFEEARTSDMVAGLLAEFGWEVHRGLAGTGVVGALAGKGAGDQSRAIGLRADMDALFIDEKNSFPHRSTHEGRMHACGHDGHTAMLLGAAKQLADTRNFTGTVFAIFQPAEENEGGGRVMVEDGLFHDFPMEAVYGLHNIPGLEAGTFAMIDGPVMAAFDSVEITLSGTGAHAAMPHRGQDAIVAAAQLVTALQTISSRRIDPMQASVLSITQIHGGDTWNVIPEEVVLRGTARAFHVDVRAEIERAVRELAAGIGTANGVGVTVDYQRRYPATVNSSAQTAIAVRAATKLVGEERVSTTEMPMMGSEDFAFMLREKPGCYAWIGNGRAGGSSDGPGGEGGCELHNPHYDFNDDILPLGASYWVSLVETALSA